MQALVGIIQSLTINSLEVCTNTQAGDKFQEDKKKAIQEKAGRLARGLVLVTDSSNSMNVITYETVLVKGLACTRFPSHSCDGDSGGR